MAEQSDLIDPSKWIATDAHGRESAEGPFIGPEGDSPVLCLTGYHGPDVNAKNVVAILTTAWRQFSPHEWHGRGSCYPCVLVSPEGEAGIPCDPWTLPHDNDWSGWIACALPATFTEQQLAKTRPTPPGA